MRVGPRDLRLCRRGFSTQICPTTPLVGNVGGQRTTWRKDRPVDGNPLIRTNSILSRVALPRDSGADVEGVPT